MLNKTLFIDIDGTIFKYRNSLSEMLTTPPEILPGVREKFNKWIMKEYKIIITTGRPESAREITKRQLEECGLFYHQLIMDCTVGERVIINDKKPPNEIYDTEMFTASGINIDRDAGFKDLDI